MSPLMEKGASQFITEYDLPSIPPSDESANLGKDLEEALAKQ
jgi:ATP-binding cassette subfamily C (CFTR/MRP) protein 1